MAHTRTRTHTHIHRQSHAGILVTLEQWNPGICDIMDGSKWYYAKLNTVLWRPTRPYGTNTQKRCPFHCKEHKTRTSRNTWSNRQIWPWSTEWSRAKANTVLPREHTGHSKHPLQTTQDKTLHMDITRWSTPKSDWLYSLQPKMEKLYTVSKKQDWEQTVTWSLIPYCQIQT